MSIASARRTKRPGGLGASTVAEAFQLTAKANPDRCALRLKEDEFSSFDQMIAFPSDAGWCPGCPWRTSPSVRAATTCPCCSASPPPAAPTRAMSWPSCPRCGRPGFAVPRIWEKLKAAIEAGVAAESDGAKKQAAEWALGVGLRKVELEQAGRPLPEELRQEH